VSGFSNRPRILKGAFVEYGKTIPPLFVVFQFNPVQLQRQRSLSFRAENRTVECRSPGQAGQPGEQGRIQEPVDLREFHARFDDLDKLREQQIVSIQEETISFELRLDATDALDAGNPVTGQVGIAPALATLELMTLPKGESMLTEAFGPLLDPQEFRAPSPQNPPMVLFIWGVRRVLPVNINSLAITETEFDFQLNPVRASVAVSLTVIEGNNSFYKFSKTSTELMAVLNTANLVTDIVIPG
jgi:hypothetical protein